MNQKNYATETFSAVALECAQRILKVILICAAVLTILAAIVLNARSIARVWEGAVWYISFENTSVVPVYSMMAFLALVCTWVFCVVVKLQKRTPPAVGWMFVVAALINFLLALMAGEALKDMGESTTFAGLVCLISIVVVIPGSFFTVLLFKDDAQAQATH